MQKLSHCDDEHLVQEIKAGNMLAFDEVYRKYSKRLFRFSYNLLKSKEDAENIVQDVFLNLWANRHKIEKGTSLKYYIYTIAYHASINIIRKKLKESDYLEHLMSLQEPLEEAVDLQVEFRELDEKLKSIIDALPDRQKEVYILHRVERLKYSEISERLGISVNTIENHMSRALRTIREKLGNYSLITVIFFYLFA